MEITLTDILLLCYRRFVYVKSYNGGHAGRFVCVVIMDTHFSALVLRARFLTSPPGIVGFHQSLPPWAARFGNPWCTVWIWHANMFFVCAELTVAQHKTDMFTHLRHHSWSGINLRGIWVGHDQIHYSRPGLCPHVAWNTRRQCWYISEPKKFDSSHHLLCKTIWDLGLWVNPIFNRVERSHPVSHFMPLKANKNPA